MRANSHVHAHNGLGDMPGRIETVITQTDAQLVFALGMEASVTLEAGRIFRPLNLLVDVNFGMNCERKHISFPIGNWASGVPEKATPTS